MAVGYYALRLPSIKALQGSLSSPPGKMRSVAKYLLYLSIICAATIALAYVIFLFIGIKIDQSTGILIMLPFALNMQLQGNYFLFTSRQGS